MIGVAVEDQNSGCQFLDDGIYNLHLAIIQLKARVKEVKAKKRSFLYHQLRHYEKRLRKLKSLKDVLRQKKS